MSSNNHTLNSRFTSPRPLSPAYSPARKVAATLSFAIALALAGCATPMLRSTVDVPDQFTGTVADELAPAVSPKVAPAAAPKMAPVTAPEITPATAPMAAPAAAPNVTPVSAPEAASAAATEGALIDASEVTWWQGYGDPVLSALIEHAARQNRDVRIAAERVRAARAGQTIAQSQLLPSIGLNLGQTKSTNGYDGAAQLAMPEVNNKTAGLDVSWEIDLSGRLSAGAKAAKAEKNSTEDQARGVRLLVLTDVATSYFTLTGALRQLETVRSISAAQDETLRLISSRQQAGLASSFDVDRARADAESARAAIPPLETLVAVSRHRLAVLGGDQPKDAAAIEPWKGVVTVPEITPGQPASLLERRPDLLAMRAELEAANWRRRQAHAEWFPRLFLGALFGGQNNGVNGIGLGSARFANAAGMLAMPLLNWGRTKAINESAVASQNEAQLRYEDAIVRALEDVENALVALRDTRQRTTYLASAAASSDAALGRARSLYDHGQIDLLPLLDAQRAQLQVRMGSNDSQTQLLLESVRLFKALGGGWQAFEPATAASPETQSAPNHPASLASTNEDKS